MRFTDGLWKDRDGYRLHRAHELWEYEIKEDCVKAMVPCCEIRSLRDTINEIGRASCRERVWTVV